MSDDDFARVVIAERFAHAPSLDPSGTSWLPLPFWLTGSAMLAFGRTLGVARAVGVASGVLSALLMHRAARWMGASRAAAFLGAALASLVPTAARLGASFQPEALTAGLVLLGAAATQVAGSRRWAGAAALGAACLCRYEAWAAALAFAGLAVHEITRAAHTRPEASASEASGGTEPKARGGAAERPPGNSPTTRNPDTPATAPATATVCALAALVAPLMWVIHGWAHHHDALFFLHRVAAYRHALGGAEGGLSAIGGQALAVLREPELVLGSVFAVLVGRRADRQWLGRFARPAVVVGAVLAFLVAGELVGGSATHHVERTLLPVWGLLAIVGADAALRAAGSAAFRLSLALSLGGAVLAGLAIRARAPEEALAPRTEELAIGSVARRLLPATEAPLLVDTADYGYFAVIASFGAPERAAPFVTHDPREHEERDPFATPNTLRSALARRRARFFVTQRANVPVATAVGKIVGETPAFALVDAGPVPGLAPGFGMRAPAPEP